MHGATTKKLNNVLTASSHKNTSLSTFLATILLTFRHDLPTSGTYSFNPQGRFKSVTACLYMGLHYPGTGRCVYCIHCFVISMNVFWPICNVMAGLRLHMQDPQVYFCTVTRIVVIQPALFLTPLNPDCFYMSHQV